MLFFCEECGGKNMLPDVPAEEKVIRFRCQLCGYQTVIEREPPVKDPGSEVEEQKRRAR